jgi:hypothetical protein
MAQPGSVREAAAVNGLCSPKVQKGFKARHQTVLDGTVVGGCAGNRAASRS